MAYILKQIPAPETKEYPKIYLIDHDVIGWIKQKVINMDRELCASMKPSKKHYGYLVISSETIKIGPVLDPKKQGQRGLCEYKKYSDILLHIHPSNAEGYPTTKDILDTLEHHEKMQVSVIGTRWGIWVLYNKYHLPSNYSERNKDILRKKISKEIKNFELIENVQKSDLENIANVILKVDNITNMAIDLYLWSDISSKKDKIPVRVYDNISKSAY